MSSVLRSRISGFWDHVTSRRHRGTSWIPRRVPPQGLGPGPGRALGITWRNTLVANEDMCALLNALNKAGLRNTHGDAHLMAIPMPHQRGGRLRPAPDGSWSVSPGSEDHPAYWVTWIGAAACALWEGARLPSRMEMNTFTADAQAGNCDYRVGMWHRSANRGCPVRRSTTGGQSPGVVCGRAIGAAPGTGQPLSPRGRVEHAGLPRRSRPQAVADVAGCLPRRGDAPDRRCLIRFAAISPRDRGPAPVMALAVGHRRPPLGRSRPGRGRSPVTARWLIWVPCRNPLRESRPRSTGRTAR